MKRMWFEIEFYLRWAKLTHLKFERKWLQTGLTWGDNENVEENPRGMRALS